MSLLLNPLLLATLAAIITVSYTQDHDTGTCCQVGRDGRDGRDGEKGEKGEAPREKGEQGVMGLSGSPGAKGDPGDQGFMGPHGPAGEKGMRGAPGLHGPQGDQGLVGSRGPAGEKGMHGDPGLRGPQGVQGAPGPCTGGVTYTRWGRTTCPTIQGTQLLYAGRAAGTHHAHSGGAANYLCLPNDPDHLPYENGDGLDAYIAGVEYDYNNIPSLSSVNYYNAPCAVCYVATRSASVMIPAKTQCPTHWTQEYIGYLMATDFAHAGRSMYECVDRNPESIPGSAGQSDPRAFFQTVEPYCNGLVCPPYNAWKELTCAVCTR